MDYISYGRFNLLEWREQLVRYFINHARTIP